MFTTPQETSLDLMRARSIACGQGRKTFLPIRGAVTGRFFAVEFSDMATDVCGGGGGGGGESRPEAPGGKCGGGGGSGVAECGSGGGITELFMYLAALNAALDGQARIVLVSADAAE